jgi:hypothetical protein
MSVASEALAHPRAHPASRRSRRALLTSTAFTGVFIAVIAGHPHSALAACSGINTASVLCDANNPSGGSLDTISAGSSTVTVNAGAGITGFAGAFASGGDLTLIHNDPAGIGNGGASNAIELAAFNGAINYTGAGNVSGANAAIAVNLTNGPVSITQSSGVLSGVFGIRFDSAFPPTNVIIDTTGSQINATDYGILAQNIQPSADTNFEITTGAVSAGVRSIWVDLQAGKNINVHTKGAVNGEVRLQNRGLGSTSFIADEVVNGNISLIATGNSNNTAPVSLTLAQDYVAGSAAGISVAGRRDVTVQTKNISGGGIIVNTGNGTSSVLIDGSVNATPASVGISDFNLTGVRSITTGIGSVIVNGPITIALDRTGVGGSQNSRAVGFSFELVGPTSTSYVKGPVSATAIADGAGVGTATAIGASLSTRSGTHTVDGVVTAAAIGPAATATGVSASGGGSGGQSATLLNGSVSATARRASPARAPRWALGHPSTAERIRSPPTAPLRRRPLEQAERRPVSRALLRVLQRPAS